MPARNGTGPEGKGALTGRGFGNCSSSQQNAKLERFGFGRGNRGGRGRGQNQRFRGRIS